MTGINGVGFELAVSSILLKDYVLGVKDTDLLSGTDLIPVLLGLYGEVGSIMASSKKTHRERGAYTGFRLAAEEEFGDALWYLNALAKRTGISLQEIFVGSLEDDEYSIELASSGILGGVLAQVYSRSTMPSLDGALMALGESAGDLLKINENPALAKGLLTKFAGRYTAALQAANLDFSGVIRRNLAKSQGRFLPPDYSSLPDFDSNFELDERLPSNFEIQVSQRMSGKSYLQWNGVYIGDPLTDNIADGDGYRYHDVFHLAYASVLHWSPVFRSLIKHKRKSNPVIDETQDGGRAIVVEEGLSAWLFTRAKDLNFFEGQTKISLDVLKIVHQFVRGYEVDQCPLSLWEQAILQGYGVFRQLKKNNGGVIVCDRNNRTIQYRTMLALNS
jgi:hypothetical protein